MSANFWDTNPGDSFWGTNQGLLDSINNSPDDYRNQDDDIVDDDGNINYDKINEIANVNVQEQGPLSPLGGVAVMFGFFCFVAVVATFTNYVLANNWWFHNSFNFVYIFLISMITCAVFSAETKINKEETVNGESIIDKEEVIRENEEIKYIALGICWIIPIFVLIGMFAGKFTTEKRNKLKIQYIIFGLIYLAVGGSFIGVGASNINKG
jgi:hypothetical protein